MPTLILFAPLIGALICGFGWRFIGEKPATVTATALLFFSALLSWVVFFGHSGDTVETSIDLEHWTTTGVTLTEPDLDGQVTASVERNASSCCFCARAY